ncbi:MAG: GNAT family N-acetyltransferase [Bacteroidales bacterium]|nr:GNAT family N-acetyltransferase [Bacteroidales bacterium]
MSVTLVTVKDKKLLKKFIRFPLDLYKGNDYWVPALEGDEYDTFNPKKNGAWDFSTAECYLAYKDGKIAGRVAAIINFKANDLWKENTVRFGWLDFIEDQEVLNALMDAVVAFGHAHGCDTMKGPLGFTDMDKEGLLVDGYDKLSPFTCLYNYPYYDTLLKNYGLQKEADWIQKKIEIGPELPKIYEVTDTIEKRYGLHMAQAKNTTEMCKKYGMSIFHMYNDSFAPLFQFCPLTDKQIESYLQTYVPILDIRYVAVCLNAEDQPVGFAFCVPTLSKAVKKSNGRLFPFGFARILHALKKNDTLEALLIGVMPEYQGKGASLLLLKYIHQNCIKAGIKTMIVNPQLEDNFRALTLLDHYDHEVYLRRRSYTKTI